ncbi:MAG: hypothetical protein HOE90_13005 [Bacteriovoracaceae bacterium]|jgi:hypothetical protein|nr:hypothetical protein [Bacteriovoracaceae bacterium]
MNLNCTPTNWEEVVSACLGTLKQRFPSFSDSQLADKIKIPRSTFNRLQNETKKPKLDTYLKIITGSGMVELLPNALAYYDKDLGESLEGVLEVSLQEDNKKLTDQEFEDLLESRECFVAYLLADTEQGTDQLEVTSVLGAPGLESMKHLVLKGLIKETDGRFHVVDKKTIVRSFESVRHHLTTYAKHYKTEHIGKQRNYVHSVSDGMNKNGIKALQEAHRKFHKEVQQIIRNTENRGDIPMFSVGFCDSFTPMENSNEKGELQ